MKKTPRVIELLKAYEKGNLGAVIKYLNEDDLVIDTSSWCGKIKVLLDKKLYQSVEAEIASLLHTFKLEIKLEKI